MHDSNVKSKLINKHEFEACGDYSLDTSYKYNLIVDITFSVFDCKEEFRHVGITLLVSNNGSMLKFALDQGG